LTSITDSVSHSYSYDNNGSTTNVAAGPYSYTTRAYDNDGATATSAAIGVRVNGPPSVAVTSPTANAIYAARVNVPLAASASDADGTIAKVDFYANGTVVGTAAAAPYAATWVAPASGSYTVTAIATDNNGAATTSAPVAIRVNTPPQVSLTAPVPNTVVNAPGTFDLAATAADSDGTIVKVEFYANGNVIGGATQPPYTVAWSNVPAGAYSITVVATDSDGGTATSSAVPVRVNGYPTVTLTSPTANATFKPAATITLTASAQDFDGTINRVEFYAGTTLVATVTAAPYAYTWTNVAAGNYSLTARAVDDAGAGTVSAPVAITIASAEAQIYYIHTDHLNTPRMITNAQREVVWTWMNDDPFGANPANEDPRNTGSFFTCNLRFPGQYFDKETNLHYNYFRDYEPAIGRYVQSDPIGLRAGLNTYSYVRASPLHKFDRYGLLACGPESKWTKHLIPDNFYMPTFGVPILMFSFEECCTGHDTCYGVRCTPTKKDCDTDFYDCMKGTCGASMASVMPICYLAARFYYEAVSTTRMAQQAFDEARRGCKRC